jgi:arginyl-tRNA synthetase
MYSNENNYFKELTLTKQKNKQKNDYSIEIVIPFKRSIPRTNHGIYTKFYPTLMLMRHLQQTLGFFLFFFLNKDWSNSQLRLISRQHYNILCDKNLVSSISQPNKLGHVWVMYLLYFIIFQKHVLSFYF